MSGDAASVLADAEREAAAALAAGESWRAVQILADAWGPALARSYRLGYQNGFRAGVVAGRAEEADAWQKIMGVWRQTVKRPSFAELKRRRGEAA